MLIYINENKEIDILHKEVTTQHVLIGFSSINDIMDSINNKTYSYLINHRGDKSVLEWIEKLLNIKLILISTNSFIQLIPVIDSNVYLLRKLFYTSSQIRLSEPELPLFIYIGVQSMLNEYVDLQSENIELIDSLVVKGFIYRLRLTDAMLYKLSETGKILFLEFSKALV